MIILIKHLEMCLVHRRCSINFSYYIHYSKVVFSCIPYIPQSNTQLFLEVLSYNLKSLTHYLQLQLSFNPQNMVNSMIWLFYYSLTLQILWEKNMKAFLVSFIPLLQSHLDSAGLPVYNIISLLGMSLNLHVEV